MPLNCPIKLMPFFDITACDDCMKYDKMADMCGWFLPRLPLNDILTPEERLKRLENRDKPQGTTHTHIHIGEKTLDINRRVGALEDKHSNLDKEVQSHLSSHWDKKKGGKPKTYIKYT